MSISVSKPGCNRSAILSPIVTAIPVKDGHHPGGRSAVSFPPAPWKNPPGRREDRPRLWADCPKAWESRARGWERMPKAWERMPESRESIPGPWERMPNVWAYILKPWASRPELRASFPEHHPSRTRVRRNCPPYLSRQSSDRANGPTEGFLSFLWRTAPLRPSIALHRSPSRSANRRRPVSVRRPAFRPECCRSWRRTALFL